MNRPWVWVAAIVLGVMFAPLLTTDPRAQDLLQALHPPLQTWTHPLGTDALGRDLLAEVLHGLRLTLLVGVGATALSACLGVPLGLLAGTRGGALEVWLMRAVDVQLSLPGALVGMVSLALWGPGFEKLILVLGVSGWAGFARLARAGALSQRHQEYLLGAQAIGANGWRLALRHVLPNIAGSLIVKASLEIPANMLLEATLSFLGLGAGVNSPSLGQLVASGYARLASGEWWLSLLPGAALTLLVLGVNALGEHLRDRLDPHAPAQQLSS